MKVLLIAALLGAICLFRASVAESTSFVGPTGVGLGVGAVCRKKNFNAGIIISIDRTRGHLSSPDKPAARERRSPFTPGLAVGAAIGFFKAAVIGALLNRPAPRYNRYYHRSPRTNYYYSRPANYYYSSEELYVKKTVTKAWSKRSVEEMEQLHRLKREAEELDYDLYLLEMSNRDQDDCMKKLVCQISAIKAAGQPLTIDERAIIEDFQDDALNVASNAVAFNVAAKIGRELGDARCINMYQRCATSLSDQLAMIEKEVEDLEPIRLELEGLSPDQISEAIEAEAAKVQEELSHLDIEADTIWD